MSSTRRRAVGERFGTRVRVVSRALARRLAAPPAHHGDIRRVLVAHNLLLGDTLMLTPLLSKLRSVHRDAEITLLAAPAFVPLYAKRPYGVRALAFKPSEISTTRALMGEAAFDLAVVAGDNRYSWLAAAMGARHVVAHADDPHAGRNWFVDETRAYAPAASAWGDMVAQLVDGPAPAPYGRADWPAPDAAPFETPAGDYAVLHLGASTPLKQWRPERWMALAQALEQRGLAVVWSAGRGEEGLVGACDPHGRFASYAGRLDLPQLWGLLAGARLLVAPDTGIAHLGRVTWTPTVTLFGPGSAVICGRGDFWRDTPWRAVTEAEFPCRDQTILFRREIDWVRRCGRSTRECAEPRCMHALSVEAVVAAADGLLQPH
jgi:ADP-heptose:LPS heptosyltransferase